MNNLIEETIVELTPAPEKPSTALQKFKKKKSSSFVYSYIKAKKQSTQYKIIFYTFCTLFLSLFCFIYNSPISINFLPFIHNPSSIKTILLVFSLSLALFSGWLAIQIKAEYEVIKRIYKDSRKAIYRSHCHRAKKNRASTLRHLKHHFEEALAKLDHLRHEAEGLHVEVEHSKKHSSLEKQQLHEQILQELQRRCEAVVDTFSRG